MARMIIGMTTSGVFLVSYVLAMEMVGPKYRLIAGTLCQYYYTFGFFAMCLVAYFLNDNWHLLQVNYKESDQHCFQNSKRLCAIGGARLSFNGIAFGIL